MRLSSLTLCFPLYNEAANLPTLIESADKIGRTIAHNYEIILINDGSSDNSAQILQSYRQNSHIKIIHHKKNYGYGRAIRSGIQASTKKWFFFSDADNQFDLQELKQFLPHIQNHQILTGYRQNRADPTFRKLYARLWITLIKTTLKIHLKDLNCAFKLFKSDHLKSLKLSSDGALINAEIFYKLKPQQLSLIELPVTHRQRLHGEPTGGNLKVVIKAFRELIQLKIKKI